MSYVHLLKTGEIQIDVRGIDEARSAVKELKALKKTLQDQKKEAREEMRRIRASHMDLIRRPESKIKGNYLARRLERRLQAIGREKNRRLMDAALLPFEQRKQRIENAITEIRKSIAGLNSVIALDSLQTNTRTD